MTVDEGWKETNRFHELLRSEESWSAFDLSDGFPQWYMDLLVRLKLIVGDRTLEYFDSYVDGLSARFTGKMAVEVVALTDGLLITAEIKIEANVRNPDFAIRVQSRSEIVGVDVVRTRGVDTGHRDEPETVLFELRLREGRVVRLPVAAWHNAERGKAAKELLASIVDRL